MGNVLVSCMVVREFPSFTSRQALKKIFFCASRRQLYQQKSFARSSKWVEPIFKLKKMVDRISLCGVTKFNCRNFVQIRRCNLFLNASRKSCYNMIIWITSIQSLKTFKRVGVRTKRERPTKCSLKLSGVISRTQLQPGAVTLYLYRWKVLYWSTSSIRNHKSVVETEEVQTRLLETAFASTSIAKSA